MAKEARDGYRFVKVPKGALVKTRDEDGGRFAEVGEEVEISEKTLSSDPFLSEFVIGRSKEEKESDPFHQASAEELREALKKNDLDSTGDKNELIARAKKHGLRAPRHFNPESTNPVADARTANAARETMKAESGKK